MPSTLTQLLDALLGAYSLILLGKAIVSWFPVTQAQRDQFIQLSIRAGWIGIAALVILWIIVRFVGPAAGWWIPADIR